MGLGLSDRVLEEASLYYVKMAKRPRLDFLDRRQVRLLRIVMPLVALLTSPLRRLGLRARRMEIEANGRTVGLRIIEPRGTPIGLVVDIHGGAWTIMRAANDDPLTGPMAAEGLVVVSVDYRLAPEHPFDDVLADCAAALRWALDEGARRFGVEHVFLHGDSAGAHLCMTSALACVGDAYFHLLKGLVLFFGAYDLSGTPSVRSAPASSLGLRGDTLAPFFAHISGREGQDALRAPDVSPMYADLEELPPTLLLVGTADPLLDDTILLHRRLADQGIDTELVAVPDAPHAFNRLPIQLAELTNGHARGWIMQRVSQPPA